MMGLPCGGEIMIVGRTMWTQSTSVTDRQTDGLTDRITITKTAQRRASHGKNCLLDEELSLHAIGLSQRIQRLLLGYYYYRRYTPRLRSRRVLVQT